MAPRFSLTKALNMVRALLEHTYKSIDIFHRIVSDHSSMAHEYAHSLLFSSTLPRPYFEFFGKLTGLLYEGCRLVDQDRLQRKSRNVDEAP